MTVDEVSKNKALSATKGCGQSSTQARLLQEMQHALRHLPAVDQQRVTAVKRAIRDGSYHIDTTVVANKLIDFEKNLHILK